MDILQLLKQDHAKVNQLFEKLVATSDGARKTRERLFDQLRTELHVHHRMEEKHLYPAMKKQAATRELAEHAIQETKEAEKMLSAIARIDVADEAFMEKVTELQQAIRDHVREEEDQLVPQGLEEIPAEKQKDLLRKMQEEKKHEMQASR